MRAAPKHISHTKYRKSIIKVINYLQGTSINFLEFAVFKAWETWLIRIVLGLLGCTDMSEKPLRWRVFFYSQINH